MTALDHTKAPCRHVLRPRRLLLTDNGMAPADLPKYRDGPTACWMGHIFDRVCREHGIDHRLTKPTTRGGMARQSG
jgi:hypothetical protein